MSTTRHGSSHVIIASSINSNGRTSEFFADAKISPLTEPARPYQSAGLFQSAGISQSMFIRERVWNQKYAFLSQDRKVGQNALYWDAFLSQAKTFCPGTERRDRKAGQKGGTERRDRKAGQKGGTERRDRTSRYFWVTFTCTSCTGTILANNTKQTFIHTCTCLKLIYGKCT